MVVVARVAQGRALAARAVLVLAVLPQECLAETGPVQQVIHLAVDAAMPLARVDTGT